MNPPFQANDNDDPSVVPHQTWQGLESLYKAICARYNVEEEPKEAPHGGDSCGVDFFRLKVKISL